MYKFVKCMAVCLCAMAIAACQKALARDLVFTANILSSSDNKAVGIYDFTPSGSTLTAVPRFTGPTINGNGGGVVSDDVYHYIRWTEAIGFIFPYYHAVSLEDGSQVAYSESIHSNDQSYFATDLAYNARDGKIYGVFYNSDRTGYVLATIDYASLTRSDIGELTEKLIALAVDPAGNFYGFGSDGNLYNVSRADASLSKIGSTGIIPSSKRSSAVCDPVTGNLYWAVVLSDNSSRLYEVSRTDATLTETGLFPAGEEITGLYIAAPEADDDAPARVSGLTASFPAGGLRGTVSFTLPALTYGGNALTGDLSWTIHAGETLLAEGNSGAGSEVRKEVTLPAEGTYRIYVRASNAAGPGARAMVKAVAGFGIPAAPANVKLEKTDSRLILTWDETNTTSDGAGAFIDLDGMTYTVVDASGATVAADLRERRYETELPGGDARSIKFGVIADNHGKRSDTAWSPSVQVGEGISLPYRNDLDSQEKFSELLTDDANNDGTTWVFNAAQGTAYIQTSKAADDWLLTPAVTLEKGRRYRLGMKVKNNNRTRQETVGSGFRADKETEYTVVREATVLPAGTDWQEYADEFEVPATGTYRVGVHAMSEKSKNRLVVDYISLEEVASGALPDAVRELSVTPAPKGELKATVHFVTPDKDTEGSPLKADIEKVTVRRGDVEVFVKEAPGHSETIEFTDTPDAPGLYAYTVSAWIGGKEGRQHKVDAYIGLDAPMAPGNVKVTESDGTVTLTWENSSETGRHGGYVDPASLTYTIYRVVKSDVVKTDVSGNSLQIQENMTGEQDYLYYGVAAANSEGLSEPALSNIILKGDPYTLPFRESFPDAIPTHFWWTDQTGKAGFDLDSQNSHDQDYGCAYFIAAQPGDQAMLKSGKIAAKGARSPILTFWYYSYPGKPVRLYVETLDLNDESASQLLLVDYSAQTGENGWRRAEADLTGISASDSFLFQFRAVCDDNSTAVAIDDVRIMDQYHNDLSVSVDTREACRPGETTPVKVTVENIGHNDAGAFTVSLISDAGTVDSRDIEGLESGKSRTLDFEVTVPLGAQEQITFRTEVEYGADENKANNTAESSPVDILEPECPAVTIAATAGNGKILLSWRAPETLVHRCAESFETYEAWSDNFGDWTSIDADGRPTVSTQGISYPGAEQPRAFFIFNTARCGQDVTVQPYTVFRPRTGRQYATCYGVQSGADDDWLISPLLSGRQQTVSFFAKSISDAYLEDFEILYTDKAEPSPGDFSVFTRIVKAPNIWERRMALLPEGTLHFAIRLVTDAASTYALLVDDVEFEGADWEISGYDIYRNDRIVATADASATSWEGDIDSDLDLYRVGVRYKGNAFSRLSNEVSAASELEHIPADMDGDSPIYNLQGIRIGFGAEDFRRLPAGIYIYGNRKVLKTDK